MEGEIEIVDWKTGAGESDELQFLVYTIYVSEVFETPLEKISVIEYNLLSDQKTIYKFSPDKIEKAKNYINESVARMKGYLQNAPDNTAVMTDFPRTEDKKKCDSCTFKKICFDLP
jgi:CRISPR/Cas system-associated exonuclease Cas4 (RecB family)